MPLQLWEVDAIEAAQVAAWQARQAAEGTEAAKPAPQAAQPEPEPRPDPEAEESDAALNARAVAMFNATLAQAPPHIREALATFTQDQLWALVERCWPKEGYEGDSAAQPQGP